MEEKKISVIMSAYNEEEAWLREAIESTLSRQTYRNIEFIIVLDKPDNTALERIILEYAAADERIVFVKNEKNLGLVGALNRALESVTGDYIARMDADDISEPERFQTQVRVLEDGGLDLVACNALYVSEDGAPVRVHPCYGKTPETCRESLRYRSILPHSGWLTRPSVYKAVGPYHDIPSAEDYEWLCRAAAMGFRLQNIDEVLLRVRWRPTGISRSRQYQQRRVAHAIRREYRRSLKAGREMRLEPLAADIARIDFSTVNTRFNRSFAVYMSGLALLEHRSPLGLFKVALGCLMCPMHLQRAMETVRLNALNRA